MAKDRKKLQHIHSSIPDKQPTPATLEVGEIAVNNAKDQEFLSVKNSEDKVVRFSSDGQLIEWIERKEVMPYEGFTRGSEGPTGSTGPDSVTNDDLLQNKSNIIIKLNQVAADNTVKHDKVNGAKDIYNKPVNPTEDFGVSDGAGFAIDMSRYAMIDANPSFSSLTATCQTTLSGNTFIRDGASGNTYGTDTGHTLDIKITDTVISGETWHETLTSKGENISGRTTTIGNDGENLHVIGTTTEVHDNDVTITNKSNVAENTSGTTIIDRKGNVSENNKSNVTVVTSGNNTTTINGNAITNVSGSTTADTGGNVIVTTSGTTSIDRKGNVSENNQANVTVITSGNNTTTISGNSITNVSGSTTADTGGNVVVTTSGTTNTNRKGSVSENNQANVTIVTSGNSTTTISGNTIENHSGTTTENLIGNFSGNTTGTTTEIKIGDVTESHSGTTTETKKGVVTETNLSAKTENTSGTSTINIVEDNIVNVSGETHITTTGNTVIHTESKLGLTAVDDIIESSEANIVITANENICETAGVNASFYGVTKTNIGTACDGSKSSATTIVGTSTINISGATINQSGDAYNITANTTNTGNLTVTEKLYLTPDCTDKISSTTVNAGLCEVFDRSVITMTKTTPDATSEILATYRLYQNGNQIGEDINIPKGHLNGIDDKNPAGLTKENTYNNISVDVWNDGNQNWVSANTTSTIHASQNVYADGTVSGNVVSGTTVKAPTISGTNITAATKVTTNGLDASGNVNITGTTNISGKTTIDDDLDVTGAANISGATTINNNLTVIGTVTSTGAIYSSDARLKNNIKRANFGKALNASNVPIKEFYFNSDPSRKVYGVIAQELEAFDLNELVVTDENGYKGVDYTSLMLLKIRFLENEVKLLKSRIDKLEKNG